MAIAGLVEYDNEGPSVRTFIIDAIEAHRDWDGERLTDLVIDQLITDLSMVRDVLRPVIRRTVVAEKRTLGRSVSVVRGQDIIEASEYYAPSSTPDRVAERFTDAYLQRKWWCPGRGKLPRGEFTAELLILRRSHFRSLERDIHAHVGYIDKILKGMGTSGTKSFAEYYGSLTARDRAILVAEEPDESSQRHDLHG
jgi:hypothetical protein